MWPLTSICSICAKRIWCVDIVNIVCEKYTDTAVIQTFLENISPAEQMRKGGENKHSL